MSVEKGVWVLAEQMGGELEEVSLELVSEGRKLADRLGSELCAILVGSNVENLADSLAHHGADKVFLLDSPRLSSYNGELYTQALSALVGEHAPGITLCGATSIGRDLAPRLAAKLGMGLVSDCVIIDLDENGAFQLTTPTHAGKVYTTVICTSDKPQMATLRPGLVEAKLLSAARKAETIKVDPQIKPDEARVKVTGFVKADPKTIDLEEAEVIVAGGGGMGAKENFRLLEELAEVLGGSVAGSRVPVDEGWITIERQVGQTSKTVASQLYIACGISGSIYHTMGMKDCKVIIAINKDRAAPIFKLADVGVVGDVLEVVPALIDQLCTIPRPDDT